MKNMEEVTISLTGKGQILCLMIDSVEEYEAGKELLNEFANVMGPGIFDALLEIKSPEETLAIIKQWEAENR